MKVMSKAKKSKIIFKNALPFSYALVELPLNISFFHSIALLISSIYFISMI